MSDHPQKSPSPWAHASQPPNVNGFSCSCPNAFKWAGQPGPPSSRLFLGPTRVSSVNGISVGSAVSAGLTNVTDRQTDRHTHVLLHPQQQPTFYTMHAMRSNNYNNKHYCVLSNSGLSNATSKRPKLVLFRGKICPPKSGNCQVFRRHLRVSIVKRKSHTAVCRSQLSENRSGIKFRKRC